MTERRNEVASGDHFLLSAGALAEWSHPVAAPLTGHVFLHMAHVDGDGVVVRFELSLVRGGDEIQLVEVDDSSDGEMGYVPFEGCFHGAGADRAVQAGDHLLLRATNLTDGMLGIVTRSPDYFTWIEVEML